MLARSTVLLSSCLAMWGCHERGKSQPDGGPAPPDAPSTCSTSTGSHALDLLFVIDDSPSMLDKQANLRANFPNFVNALSSLPGGMPDLHIGVISTDLGALGADDTAPGPTVGVVGNGGCGGTGKGGVLQLGQAGDSVAGTFLSDIRTIGGERIRNYTGDLATVFGQMATLGATGCGFEAPLEAMKRALSNTTQNAGFLRPDAYLAVVFLTDEDDCSFRSASALFAPDSPALGALQSFRCTRFGVTCAVGGETSDAMNQVGAKSACSSNESSTLLTRVGDYATFLRGLKPDPCQVIVAGIVGPPTPVEVELRMPPGSSMSVQALRASCVYTGATGEERADPAVRLQLFLDQFPGRTTSTTICQQDLSGGLAQIAALLRDSIGP